MRSGATPREREGGRQARARLAWRRVDGVLIDVRGTRVACRAFGARHRRPAVRRISLLVAMELAADGVPTTVVGGARR